MAWNIPWCLLPFAAASARRMAAASCRRAMAKLPCNSTCSRIEAAARSRARAPAGRPAPALRGSYSVRATPAGVGVANLKHGTGRTPTCTAPRSATQAPGRPAHPARRAACTRRRSPAMITASTSSSWPTRRYALLNAGAATASQPAPRGSFALKPAEPWIASASALAHGGDHAALRPAPETAGQSTLAESRRRSQRGSLERRHARHPRVSSRRQRRHLPARPAGELRRRRLRPRRRAFCRPARHYRATLPCTRLAGPDQAADGLKAHAAAHAAGAARRRHEMPLAALADAARRAAPSWSSGSRPTRSMPPRWIASPRTRWTAWRAWRCRRAA